MRVLLAVVVALSGCSAGYQMKYGARDATYRELAPGPTRTALVDPAPTPPAASDALPGAGYAVVYPLGYWEKVKQLEPGHEVRIWVDGWTGCRFAYHHFGGVLRFVVPL